MKLETEEFLKDFLKGCAIAFAIIVFVFVVTQYV